MASTAISAAPGNEKFYLSHQLKADELCQNFVTINNTKFLDNVMKIAKGVIIIRTVIFTLLYNKFRLLLINDHNMDKDR
jgi:hypothetical protein